ncbi:hypothetical protein [Microbacterium sulfonylureivorans]|uniref:hypothetical protein n=1 Tax=Microbacterium sulfonylureivorans TaxID=2486854 RepID=UPI0013DEC91F|nr:hypothetical protein [Microbacterium sulfonylureivorans]
MVYILVGGPRNRQLVDELPSQYEPAEPTSATPRVVLLDDLIATPAVWAQPDD